MNHDKTKGRRYKKGDRIMCLVDHGGNSPDKGTLGVVLYVGATISDILVAFDNFTSGHNGPSSFKKIVKGKYEGRCWWIHPDNVKLIESSLLNHPTKIKQK